MNKDIELREDYEDENLFVDDTPASQEEGKTVEKTEEKAVEKTEETESPFLTIKYNKEEKGLTMEEAIELAQKGMNYDKINEKFTNLNTTIEGLAKRNNLDIDTYIKKLNDTQFRYETNNEIKALKEQYPEASEDLIKELAEKRVNEKLVKQERIAENEKAKQDELNQKEIERQVQVFESQYPDIDVSKLDDKVYSMMEKGYTLLEAYTIWQAEDINKSVNEANKKKSIGNTTSTDVNAKDYFLEGFEMD